MPLPNESGLFSRLEQLVNYLRAYLGTVIAFLVIDIAWIVTVVRPFYEERLGALLKASPDMAASAVFYLAYAAGIVLLAVDPAIRAGSAGPALLRGAVLGALAYGTYTVTNYAILEAWTPGLLVTDIAWGTFLTAVCAACGYLASR